MAEPHRNDDDLITELVKDHREVEELFAAYDTSSSPDKKGDVAREIITELVRHSVAEEMWLYPVAKRALPDGEQITEHEIAEHAEVERLLKEVERLDPAEDAAFEDNMQIVMRDIRHHVEDEERDLFPRLRGALDAEELASLGEKARLAKRTAPTHPHPSAPDHPPANLVLGPLTGIVDRARDRFSRARS